MGALSVPVSQGFRRLVFEEDALRVVEDMSPTEFLRHWQFWAYIVVSFAAIGIAGAILVGPDPSSFVAGGALVDMLALYSAVALWGARTISRRRRDLSFIPKILQVVPYAEVSMAKVSGRALKIELVKGTFSAYLKPGEGEQVVNFLQGRVPTLERS